MSRPAPSLITLLILFMLPSLVFSSEGPRIPTSARSREAISRVLPALKQELSRLGLQYGAPIFIRIFKHERELEMWVMKGDRFRRFKTYPVCTYGTGGLGPKIRQGDGKAPEGFYYVAPASLNPFSKFHLSINLGYPNRYDRLHKRTGGALMIHGNCVSIGCFAMTNPGIEEIFALADGALRNGQPFFRVHIFPFKMTDDAMASHRNSRWTPFWKNLKDGYDFFETNGHIAPNVEVRNGRYRFEFPF